MPTAVTIAELLIQSLTNSQNSRRPPIYELLSAEEMQRLNEDIFNPLDICWIIAKNSRMLAENLVVGNLN